jgi:hypothetical protein
MSRIPPSIAFVLLLAAPSLAMAQESPATPPAPVPPPPVAPPAPGDEKRYEALAARQQQLEAVVQAQAADLRALTAKPDAARTPDPELTAPLAGYADGNVFVRDRHDWFVLLPKGRVQVDYYNFLNRPHPAPGIVANSDKDSARASLRDTLFIRRARIGLAGTVARHIDFRFEADFASLATTGQYATITDAFVVLNWLPYLKLQAGQYYAPFTIENSTSTNYTDFMERSTVVRFAVPYPREIGAQIFGDLPRRVARYQIGVFDGDGQNFKNQDNQPAVIGRIVLAPLALWSGRPEWLEDAWVGGSFWWQRADNVAGGVAPSTTGAAQNDLQSVTTQGGFSIFSSNYGNGTDANKNAIRAHLAPDGNVIKYAFEINLPVWRGYGLRSEFVHQSIDVRQYNDVNPGNGNLTRTSGAPGHLDGWGAYIEAWAWVWGNVSVPRPGYYDVVHWKGYVPARPASWGLMLAAKYEHVEFNITDLPSTPAKSAPILDPAVGHYGLDTFELGANLWFSRHARLTANYALNYVGMGDPNQAAANEKKNIFFQQYEHELLFRLQVSL